MTAYDIFVGIDGGDTTGVAIFDVLNMTMYIGYQEGRHAVCDMLSVWEQDVRAGVLVAAEKFRILGRTPKLTEQQGTIKVNGAIEWLCHRRNWDYEEQQAASAKNLVTDERLREMELYVPTRGGHANDATRHCILAVERHIPRLLDDDTLFGYNGRVAVHRRSTGS